MPSELPFESGLAALEEPSAGIAESRSGEPGRIEPALEAVEAEVAAAQKAAERLRGAVRAWVKACKVGHISNIEKSGTAAVQLVAEVEAAVHQARGSWTFDVRGYLDSSAWRTEIIECARERYALRVIDDDALRQLISSPVAVQAVPGRGVLRFGRLVWPSIRPRAVAAELKRLRDRLSEANSQELLDALQAACRRVEQRRPDSDTIAFRDAYDLFCLAPGYKRENPRPLFAMQLYALYRAQIRATRSGEIVRWEFPASGVKERDVFPVRDEDGRELRFWGISFLSE